MKRIFWLLLFAVIPALGICQEMTYGRVYTSKSGISFQHYDSLVVLETDTINCKSVNPCSDPIWTGMSTYRLRGHSWVYNQEPRWGGGGCETRERICEGCLVWQKVKIWHLVRRQKTRFQELYEEKFK